MYKRFAAVTVLLLALGTQVSANAGSVPTEATDSVTAMAAAIRSGVPVEAVDRRTESARVFANPSGTWTLEQHVMPVRTFKAGQWVPIDPTLTRRSDGSVVPQAVPLDLRLSGGGRDPLVTMVKGDAAVELSWPEPLPVPRLAGDSATYAAVMPGVDLVIRVDSTGFSQVLVVHNASAATNLGRITLGTALKGVQIRPAEGGGSVAVDAKGAPVFTSAPPSMWDSRPGTPTHRTIPLHINNGELSVLPDQAMLAAPDTRYPVYIDPSYSVVQNLWTVVNWAAAGTSYGYTGTAWPRDTVRVGQTWGESDRWRAFFNLPIYMLARSTILRAWFSIVLDHSASCAATAVQVWQTNPLNSATGMTWNNSADDWIGSALDTRSGKANEAGACPQPDMLMEFEQPALKTAVQNAVNVPKGTIGFGLRIPSANESDQVYFKKFHANTARLNVEFNTAPRVPTAVSTTPPTPCGTAAAPTALPSATPSFSGAGYDPNADNVSSELSILEGETQIASFVSGTSGSGSKFAWPAVPPGVLPTADATRVFSYRARTKDTGGLFGQYSARCYFNVDTVRPQVPTVSSTDYPDGTINKSVGEPGTLTFNGSDTDVAGFLYGFSPEQTTMWVAAQTSATVPITLWPDVPGDLFDVERSLYVRAVDRAGNQSPLTAPWQLIARGRAVTTAAVAGDANGDRRADLAIAFDQGNARTAVWNLISRPGGFHTGYIGWDTGINGGFPAHRTLNVRGDFDGDSRTDLAFLREDPDSAIRVFLLLSDGSRYRAASEPAATLTGMRLSHLKLAAGDFDLDGDDDLALFQGLAGNQTKLWSMLSHRGTFAAPAPQWDSGAGNLSFDDLNAVAGDFDGDGDDDVAQLRSYPGNQTKLLVHTSNRGPLAAPVQRWDSGVGGFSVDQASIVTGNFDADAAKTDDIVALYDDGDTSARLLTLSATAGTWALKTWWDSGAAGTFNARRAVVAAGDYNVDGKADIATFNDIGSGVRRLNTYTSTGAGFGGAVTAWEGHIGDASPTVQVESGRRYRLIARHSEKCAEIPGANTSRGTVLDQWTCVATATHETFAVERIGASPYFHLKTFNAMCLDVDGWKFEDNVTVWQWTCGNGGPAQPNQQFQLDYVASTPVGMVVRVIALHSNKCLTIAGGGVANGDRVTQSACAAGPPAHQQFHIRPEP